MLYFAGLFTVPAVVVTLLFGFWIFGIVDGAWHFHIRPWLKSKGWVS